MAAVQALSSSTVEVAHAFALHVFSPRDPWQVAGEPHAAAALYESGQSPVTAQQSPAPQQNPFWQWPLEHWPPLPHGSPSGSLGFHSFAMHAAAASHSELSVQLVGHENTGWFAEASHA